MSDVRPPILAPPNPRIREYRPRGPSAEDLAARQRARQAAPFGSVAPAPRRSEALVFQSIAAAVAWLRERGGL